ncbi:MAG: hypothetical protein IRZ14_07025 [Chloroflexi bacterium]|nr:hypothetical protein [Chloroflexota bacterium]
MRGEKDDLRSCPTAYDCKDRLPELSAWMADDLLKQLPIWRGTRFEAGQMYFDLDNPQRGPFVASGTEAPPTDHTYVCRNDVPERVWARLVTWCQLVSTDQAQALQASIRDLGIGRERSAAGDARPLPPE